MRLMRNVDDVKDVASEAGLGLFLKVSEMDSIVQVLDSILCNPSSFHQMMCFHEQVLFSGVFEKLFTVCRNEVEPNRWKEESKFLAFWHDLLPDIEESELDLPLADIPYFAAG